MSVVDDVQSVMQWAADTVCPLVTLKAPPPAASAATAEGYAYMTVHPQVYGMYWPVGDALTRPDFTPPIPGILVQLQEGTVGSAGTDRTYRVRLHLGAWNPGRHDPDVWNPRETVTIDRPLTYVRAEGDGYSPTYEGWMDAWSFLDTTVRELRNAESVGGLAVDHGEGVKFGPYTDGDAVIDFYPEWYAWVEVTLRTASPAPTYLQEFL